MKEKNIYHLIQQSKEHYTLRNMNEAESLAKTALEIAELKEDELGVFQINLLFSKINNTLGEYQGDAFYFDTALRYIQKIQHFNTVNQNLDQGLDFFLSLGRIYKNKKNFEKASYYLSKGLTLCENEKNEKGLVSVKCALSDLFLTKDNLSQSLKYAEACLPFVEMNREKENELLRAEVYSQLCSVYIKQHEYGKILGYSKVICTIAKGHKEIEKELIALKNIAVFHGINGDLKEAMVVFLEVVERSTQINFRSNIATCLINIATIYAELDDHKNAIQKYTTVLKDYQNVLESFRIVIVYNNVGNACYSSGDILEAKKYFHKALNLAEKVDYKEMIALSLAQLSRIHIALSEIDNAYDLAKKSEALFGNLGNVWGIQINLLNLGHINYQEKEFKKALESTSEAIVNCKRIKDEANQRRAYGLMAKIYTEMKDFEQALHFQTIYTDAQDKYQRNQIDGQILGLDIKFTLESKQKRIDQLERENDFKSLLLEQKSQIEKQNEELHQVNDDLRQFAYVASHDLKEPIRMIGSYTQLLERHYKDRLTEDTELFFGFVSEGVHRMNNLLDALLKYTTIGNAEEQFKQVDLKDVIDLAIINLRVRVEETSAIIHCDELPVVASNKSLLIQLFQNLISNAIKFRKPNSIPKIFISVKEEKDDFVICVKDEGIGIDPAFQERVFVIFQRLHSRAQYEGTGIGLAICQKIMKRLGGGITLESKKDEGASFFISIPKREVFL